MGLENSLILCWGWNCHLQKRGTGSITKSFRDEQPPDLPKVFFGFLSVCRCHYKRIWRQNCKIPNGQCLRALDSEWAIASFCTSTGLINQAWSSMRLMKDCGCYNGCHHITMSHMLISNQVLGIQNSYVTCVQVNHLLLIGYVSSQREMQHKLWVNQMFLKVVKTVDLLRREWQSLLGSSV